MWKCEAKQYLSEPNFVSGMALQIGKVYRFRYTGGLCTPVKAVHGSKVGPDEAKWPYLLLLLEGPQIGELFNPSPDIDFELVDCTVSLTVG